jgi:nitroreductase
MINAALGLSSDDTRAVLLAAGLAPSVHNSQPWLFRIHPDSIELLADRARRLPVADPDERELRLACGAALFNIRLALLNLGIEPEVTIRLNPQDTIVATIRHGGPATRLPEETTLYRAIRRRHTNRKPFLEQPVGTSERHALIKAAGEEHCRLKIIDDVYDQAALHGLLVTAHQRQTADPLWVAEFNSWLMRSSTDQEGITLAASGPQPEMQDTWVLRDFGMGHSPVRQPGKDFESQPLIAVLASYVDDPLAQLQAGEALQRVLLSATTLGLSASFLSQVIEVAEVRSEVKQLIGGRLHPQAAMRIGYGQPVPATPRRTAEDCLVDESAS